MCGLSENPAGVIPDRNITKGTKVYFKSVMDSLWYEGTFLSLGEYQANVLISDPSYPHGASQFRGRKPRDFVTTRPLRTLILKIDQNDIDYWSK